MPLAASGRFGDPLLCQEDVERAGLIVGCTEKAPCLTVTVADPGFGALTVRSAAGEELNPLGDDCALYSNTGVPLSVPRSSSACLLYCAGKSEGEADGHNASQGAPSTAQPETRHRRYSVCLTYADDSPLRNVRLGLWGQPTGETKVRCLREVTLDGDGCGDLADPDSSWPDTLAVTVLNDPNEFEPFAQDEWLSERPPPEPSFPIMAEVARILVERLGHLFGSQAAYASEATAPPAPARVPSSDGLPPEDAPSEESWLVGVILGDFSQGKSSASQIVAQSVLGLVPVLDQLMDARDLTAGVWKLAKASEETLPDVILDFAVTLVGCIPTVGSAARGVVRIARRGAVPASGALRMLYSLGKGNAEQFLKDLPSLLLLHRSSLIQLASTILRRSATIFGVIGLTDLSQRLAGLDGRIAQLLLAAFGVLSQRLPRKPSFIPVARLNPSGPGRPRRRVPLGKPQQRRRPRRWSRWTARSIVAKLPDHLRPAPINNMLWQRDGLVYGSYADLLRHRAANPGQFHDHDAHHIFELVQFETFARRKFGPQFEAFKSDIRRETLAVLIPRHDHHTLNARLGINWTWTRGQDGSEPFVDFMQLGVYTADNLAPFPELTGNATRSFQMLREEHFAVWNHVLKATLSELAR